ncbi:uncharacterized protein LOC134827580 [Culicoides brevitarsis]|uniref:uncharacterized protein LOC134827580 n=1 Tax=Culicoides brevitarsis TaxID=469753 RepID=UPI00307B7D80
MSYYAIIFDPETPFQDKMLLVCLTPTLTGLFVMEIHFFFNEKKYRKVINWVKKLYQQQKYEEAFGCKFDFTEIAVVIWKVFKYLMILQVVCFIFFMISPILLPIENAMPILLPYTDNDPFYEHCLNFIYQNWIAFNFSIVMFGYIMLYAIFTGHLIAQTHFLHDILHKIGEIEETNYKKKLIENYVGDKKSQKLMENIVLLHNEIMSVTNQTFELYSLGTLIWEFAMILIHGVNFTMFQLYPAGMGPTFLGGIVLTSQYFLMSFISTRVQDSYSGISDAIYNSKWYAMNTSNKKTVLQVIQMAQNAKVMTVGGFGEANLERFVDALNTTRKICILIGVTTQVAKT